MFIDIYMSDCLSASAMGLVVIIKFLSSKENVIAEVLQDFIISKTYDFVLIGYC